MQITRPGQEPRYLEFSVPTLLCYQIDLWSNRVSVTKEMIFHLAASDFFQDLRLRDSNGIFRLNLNADSLQSYALRGFHKALKTLLEDSVHDTP